MSKDTKFAFNGTAHVLVGQFSTTGNLLLSLGEQAVVTIPFSGGNKALVRTPSGHPSASGGVDYGRIAGLTLELDKVSKQIMADLLSAAEIDAAGNLRMHTAAGPITPISAVVIPSVNINRNTGAVIDLTDVHWLPFLTDDEAFTETFNNTRGGTANSPLGINLMGLVDEKYGATVLPPGTQNYYHGDPAAVAVGLNWRLPVPYQPAP